MIERANIRRMVRQQIAAAIEHDIKCGENLMKEVFENLPGETDDEYSASLEVCKIEMRSIVTWLRQGEHALCYAAMGMQDALGHDPLLFITDGVDQGRICIVGCSCGWQVS